MRLVDITHLISTEMQVAGEWRRAWNARHVLSLTGRSEGQVCARVGQVGERYAGWIMGAEDFPVYAPSIEKLVDVLRTAIIAHLSHYGASEEERASARAAIWRNDAVLKVHEQREDVFSGMFGDRINVPVARELYLWFDLREDPDDGARDERPVPELPQRTRSLFEP